jgi:hypothetical protein
MIRSFIRLFHVDMCSDSARRTMILGFSRNFKSLSTHSGNSVLWYSLYNNYIKNEIDTDVLAFVYWQRRRHMFRPLQSHHQTNL